MARTDMRWKAGAGVAYPPSGSPVTPSFVQSASADSGSATAASIAPALGAGAAAGDLLVVCACSDATVTISGGGGGWTLADSAVGNQGHYLWYKIAAGGETSVTLTPSVTDTIAGAILEYAGIAATPLDVTAHSIRSGVGAVTQATGTTAATAQPVELVVVTAAPHSFTNISAPSGPSWATAASRTANATTFATGATNSALFTGDYVTSSAGTQADTCTWTNSSQDGGGIIACFKGA